MANRCAQCKFYDRDFEWNDEIDDEVLIETCIKDHNEYLCSDETCPFFKVFKARPYIEKDTNCDKCEFIHECIEEGNVIDVTRFDDERKHYIGGIGSACKRMLTT